MCSMLLVKINICSVYPHSCVTKSVIGTWLTLAPFIDHLFCFEFVSLLAFSIKDVNHV